MNNYTFIYDTKINPLSFDIVFWLAASRLITMKHARKPSSFNVALCVDGYRDIGVEAEIPTQYRSIKSYSVLYKIISICNWVRDIQICRSGVPVLQNGAIFFPDRWSPGLQPSTLREPQHMFSPMTPLQIEQLLRELPSSERDQFHLDQGFDASRDEVDHLREIFGRFILFHPRNSKFNLRRNTPHSLFAEVANSLRGKGYRILCITDLEDIDPKSEWRSSFECVEWASTDPRLRVALALAAEHNVLWSSGNISPIFFSRARFSVFGVLNSSVNISNHDFLLRKGPIFGKNPSWYQSGQSMNWVEASNLQPNQILAEVVRHLR
jgi:hypothetical protein